MWQKRVRLAIAVFVAIFAIVLVVSFRRGRENTRQTAIAPPPKLDKDVVTQGGPGHVDTRSPGRGGISLKFDSQVTYADGRSRLSGVTLQMPDKNGRSV